MRRSTKITAMLAAIAVMSGTAMASESVSYSDFGNLAEGEKIFKEGKGSVPACTTCHGQDGTGDDAMGTPRLAGQGFMFLLKQLEDFATEEAGELRPDCQTIGKNYKRCDTTMFVMNTNAAGLSPEDRRNVAAYAASIQQPETGSDMEAVKGLGQPVGVRYLGKSLAQYGAPERGIPACHSCHGYNGRGAFPVYPKLASQKYVYLVNQLKKWRDGTRSNDPLDQMQKVAQKMTDEDIHNVARFLTSAELTTLGNSRIPDQK